MLGIRLSVSLLAQNESFSWRRTSDKYQLSLIHPAVESRSRQPAPPLVTRSDSSQQKSTIETGNAFSCIFRLSRQAAFAACKKANRSNLTSPRGPKASRRKTFDLSNRGQQTARRGNSRAGQFFLKYEKNMVASQDRRRLLREPRALPPLVLGTIVNSSTVTFDSST